MSNVPRQAAVVFDGRLNEAIVQQLERVCHSIEHLTLIPVDQAGYDASFVAELGDRLSSTHTIGFAENLRGIHEVSVSAFSKWVTRFPTKFRNLRFGNKTLSEHFLIREIGSVLWLTSLQERNPLITLNWEHWVKLRTLQKVFAKQEFDHVFIGVQNRLLQRSLNRLLTSLDVPQAKIKSIGVERGIASVEERKKGEVRNVLIDVLSASKAFVGLVKRLKKIRRHTNEDVLKSIAKSERLLVSYYPSAEPAALGEGRYQSTYLRGLQSVMFPDNSEKPFSAVFFVVPNSNKSFSNCVDEIERFQSEGYSMLVLEDFLRLKDLLRILYWYGRFSIQSTWMVGRILKALISSKSLFVYEAELFKSLWFESLRSGALIEKLAYALAFRNMASSLRENCQLVYSSEFQSWEYALNLACREFENVTSIAAIQGNPAANYFQYQFDSEETNSDAAFPDICVGFSPCFEGIRNIEGINYRKGTAYRLLHLRAYLDDASSRNPAERIFFGIIGSGTYEACHAVLEFLEASSASIAYHYRVHPVLSFEKIASYVTRNGMERVSLTETKGSMQEYLKRVDVVIAADTTAAIEAVAAGCEVISPRFYGKISLCPLEHTSAPYWRVCSAGELNDVFDQIRSGERKNNYERSRQFLQEVIDLDESFSEWKTLFSA